MAKKSVKKESHGGAEYGSAAGRVEKKKIPHDFAGEEMLLNGEFDFALEEGGQTGKISLPGTLDLAGVGEKTEGEYMNWLRRDREYIGAATYKKEVEIPVSWEGKAVFLTLPRVMWTSEVFIDGRRAGACDSLSAPHVYDLTSFLSPGRHEISVRVDNSEREGGCVHGYGFHTQTIWNGVLGDLRLSARDKLFIADVKITPFPEKKEARVDLTVKNKTEELLDADVYITFSREGEVCAEQNAYLTACPGESPLSVLVPFCGEMKLWNCFEPSFYEAAVTVISEGERRLADTKKLRAGLRTFEARGRHFYLNGEKISLRGTHDGMTFCLTGCPAWEKEDWLKIMRTCKEYGLNHVRYHSVCPPEAAFEAADETGVILQAELPYWGEVSDGWKGTSFLQSELKRILDAYGNYASFCMMSMGNEHSGDWDVLAQMVDFGKRYDPRRLYVASSNEYLRPGNESVDINPGDEYIVGMYVTDPPEGQRRRIRYSERWADWAQRVEPDKDYDECVAGATVPVVAHEVGEWWMYPDLGLRKKYTGTMKQVAFDLFEKRLAARGLLRYAAAYHEAGTRLGLRLYKEDIEKLLKSRDLAGFQLLDLRDYPGQNTAMVGILDPFWESKGFLTAEEFRRMCDDTVILARFPRYVYAAGETLKVSLEVYRYAESDLCGTLEYAVSDGENVLVSGAFSVNAENNANTFVGEIVCPLEIGKSAKLTVSARIGEISNSWDVWAYRADETRYKNVLVATKLNEDVFKTLRAGGKVLFLAKDVPNCLQTTFNPPVWTFTMFSRHSCGWLIDAKHPALEGFPTEMYADMQWEDLTLGSRALPLAKLHKKTEPIVSAIDDPVRAQQLAAVEEFSVGKGRILVCTLDISSNLAARPAARQLKNSLLSYLSRTEKGGEENALTEEELKLLLADERFSFAAPPAARPLLQVEFSARLKGEGYAPWKAENDAVWAEKGYGYEISNYLENFAVMQPETPSVSYRNAFLHGAVGSPFRLKIKLPEKRDYEAYLHFDTENYTEEDVKNDPALAFFVPNIRRRPNDLRRGMVYDEEDALMTGSVAGGKWVRVRVPARAAENGVYELVIDRESYGYELAAALLTELRLF